MARVWLARVRTTGQLAAVKVLLPQLAENVAFQQMFFDEAAIASRVRHPNVCATFELGQQDRTLYIAMEWVNGPSLMRVLRPGAATNTSADNEGAARVPIRARLAARIVADTCAGLHAAHELIGDDGRPLDVVHRDVSPHNILITTDGQIKVTDFGVAKALGKSHMTVAGQLKGKLAYMSPEQLMGGAVDRRADVFALGCVLYEITTGRQPFVGEHDPQVMAQIMMGHYELPSTSMHGYPPELEAIVERALGSDPELRYPTAEHMRHALEAYLRASGPPVTSIQVADLVHQRCGRQIEERAARLFEAPAAVASPQHGSGPRAVVVPVSETMPNAIRVQDTSTEIVGPERPRRSSLLPLALAALLGTVLGLIVVGYMRHDARKARLLAPPAATATVPPAAPNAHTDVAPRPSVPPPSPSPPARQNAVHLHIAPDSAILIVGSVVLPPGARSIVRPEDGGSLHVLVRADKYEDEIFIVDSHTADDVDIQLTPVRPRFPFGGASGTSGRTKASDAGAKDASSPPSGTNGTDGKPKPSDTGTDEGPANVPPNPYQNAP